LENALPEAPASRLSDTPQSSIFFQTYNQYPTYAPLFISFCTPDFRLYRRLYGVNPRGRRFRKSGFLASTDLQFNTQSRETDIFITPGYSFKAVYALITNFHLPKSTLLMLVSALMGFDEMNRINRHAIKEKYRFYSFGDAMLII